jgi:hypothetical protein
MASLNPRDEFDLKRAYKDAAEKVAALPDRLKDEFQQAEAENREPLPVEPMTEIPGRLVVYAIDRISGDVPNELSEIIGVQRRSCAQHAKSKVILLSVQLKMILDAAGLGEKQANAPVHG